MRKKLNEEDKKRKLTITIDDKLYTIFEEYMIEINNTNKTKYIEKLIKEDLKNRNLLNDDFLF